MTITVDRGGVTANRWYESGIKAKARTLQGELKIRFQLDSKGGGQTDVRVNIDRESFEELLDHMLACDFDLTVNAFGQALVKRQAKISN